MNRDERDASNENSLQGVGEFAREVGVPHLDTSGSFLATLAVEQLLKPAISDVVSPVRRKAVSQATHGTTKTAKKIASKKKNPIPDDADDTENDES